MECDGLPSLSLPTPSQTTINNIRANNARTINIRFNIDIVHTLLARITFSIVLYVFLGKATASRRTPYFRFRLFGKHTSDG